MSPILDVLNLRCLFDNQVELSSSSSDVRCTHLEFRKESGLETETWESLFGQYLKAMGLDEITKGVSVHGDKKSTQEMRDKERVT